MREQIAPGRFSSQKRPARWRRKLCGARSNGARGSYVPEPAAHAELAANGVVGCASGRAPRSTAAAWDKRETTAW